MTTTPTTQTKQVYRVIAYASPTFCICVEAGSEAEALNIADRVDGGYWTPWGADYWEVDHAVLVNDIDSVELLPEEAHDTL